MKIIAIGGGQIGGSGKPVETTRIDKELIRLSEKEHPQLLFIPTASDNHPGYIKTVENYFGEELGCRVKALIIDKNTSKREAEEAIFSADIIYVGGGNTLKMMNRWRRLGVDQLLQKAAQKGIVLSGLSAGAICWFKYGSSDTRKFANPGAELIKISGLNLVSGLACPHYDSEKDRKPHLRELMKKTSGVAIALDDCAAIEIVDERCRIISSKDSAQGYKTFWKAGRYVEVVLNKEWSLVSELWQK